MAATCPRRRYVRLDISFEPISHTLACQVERLVAPPLESVRAVTEWLKSNGVSSTGASASGDMIHVEVPIAQANALFGANFTMYMHESTNSTMLRTLAYAIPRQLQDHISYVYPTTQ